MKKILLSLTCALVIGASLQAATVNYFIRGEGYWMNKGETPPSGTADIFNLTGTGSPDGSHPEDSAVGTDRIIQWNGTPLGTVTVTANMIIRRFYTTMVGTAGVTNMTLASGSSLTMRDFIVAPASTRNSTFSMVVLTGSTLVTSNSMQMGSTHASSVYGGVTTITQVGGIVRIVSTMNNSNGGLYLTNAAGGAGGTGNYYLQGGELHVYNSHSSTSNTAGIRIGSNGGTANFVWSGGLLNAQYTQISLSNTGSGNLSAGGNGAIATMHTSGSSLIYTQGVDAMMTIDIKDAAEYDKVIWAGGAANFADGTTISLNLIDDDPTIFTIGQTFDIFTADTITAGTFTLDGTYAAYFSADIIGGNTLQLTYNGIPEPAVSAGLLGALALAFVARRRRV